LICEEWSKLNAKRETGTKKVTDTEEDLEDQENLHEQKKKKKEMGVLV